MDPTVISPWGADWAWSLPLIVVTVVIHAFGLGVIDRRVSVIFDGNGKQRLPQRTSIFIIGSTALAATILHAFECTIWASVYSLLGAIPDRKSAMLYSLNAITAFGHADVHLQLRWQLMGSLEALNGWILFGLTTAFLFTVIQKVWPHIGHQV
jgi:hypothetical protein